MGWGGVGVTVRKGGKDARYDKRNNRQGWDRVGVGGTVERGGRNGRDGWKER